LTLSSARSRLCPWRDGEKALTRHRIAVLAGDGIGQEVIAAGTTVLQALAAREPGLELELESSRLHC
jgi:isocitrate/isopropylmalate dehydrogenase